MSTCSGCGSTHYCSKECQLKHWAEHKTPCRKSPIFKANQKVAALKKTLVEQAEKLGVDHEDTLTTANSIGVQLQEQGKVKEAEEYYRRALEGLARTLGRDHSRASIARSWARSPQHTRGRHQPRRAT